LQDLLFVDTGVDTDVQRRSFELRKRLVVENGPWWAAQTTWVVVV
jgi:hypothetical protein